MFVGIDYYVWACFVCGDSVCGACDCGMLLRLVVLVSLLLTCTTLMFPFVD